MKHILVIKSFFLLLCSDLVAQNTALEDYSVSSNISFAYNASILYPGLRGGIERPINRIEVTRYRGRRAARHFTKYRYLSAEIGYYHHPTFHDNVYLLLGWRARRLRRHNWFTELSPSVGYSRTFLGGETYEVDKNGSISLKKWSGYHYAMLAIGGGFGYKFNPRTSFYTRSSLLFMIPSNNLFYFRPTIEIGLVWQPIHFWEAHIHTVSKLRGRKS
jgi:hypothetical protein